MSWFSMKGPIEKQVTRAGEFKKPVDIDTLQQLVNNGVAAMRKNDPGGAAIVDKAIVQNVVAVAKDNGGVFTLEGLEKFNATINVANSGLGRLVGSKDTADAAAVMQLGTAMLMQVVVAW